MAPLWKHLGFLGKVTARNLFRYKKRMFMTIFGIAGCMALLLFGYSIKDSVADLNPRQYGEIFRYDLLAVSSEVDDAKLVSLMKQEAGTAVPDFLEVEMQSVKMSLAAAVSSGSSAAAEASSSSSGKHLSVQLVVVPDGADISRYVNLRSHASGEELPLNDGDVFCSINAAKILGFHEGDAVTIQLPDLAEASVRATGIVDNYLSNYVYMTEKTFEEAYSEERASAEALQSGTGAAAAEDPDSRTETAGFISERFEPNAVLAHLDLSAQAQTDYADALAREDGVLKTVSIADLQKQFGATFRLMNIIVLIVIVMSAALAFVVLFTLQTTNLSEREREMATIKVLGFYDREVHAYLDRETFILTAIGIVAGMPLGRLFAQSLVVILNLPSIYLAVSLNPESYLYSAGLSALFALIVSLIGDRTLNKIDPATALKSVE